MKAKFNVILDVPPSFYKNDYFQVCENDLREFLTNMVGYISASGEACFDIDIELTVKMHTGDCRVWDSNGTYVVLDEMEMCKIIMKSEELMPQKTIFDWMERYTPNLFKKHKRCR